MRRGKADRERRRLAAEDRQAKRDRLSNDEQLALLSERPGESRKERERLNRG